MDRERYMHRFGRRTDVTRCGLDAYDDDVSATSEPDRWAEHVQDETACLGCMQQTWRDRLPELPPFYYKRSAEHYHGDRSKSTTIRVTAFYRSVEFTYSRPWMP